MALDERWSADGGRFKDEQTSDIKDEQISDISPVHLLHGPNGWGKSTLLRAIRDTSDALVGLLDPLPKNEFDACRLTFHDDSAIFMQRFAGLVRVGVSPPDTAPFDFVRHAPLHSSEPATDIRECPGAPECRHYYCVTLDLEKLQHIRSIGEAERTFPAADRANQVEHFALGLRLAGTVINPTETVVQPVPLQSDIEAFVNHFNYQELGERQSVLNPGEAITSQYHSESLRTQALAISDPKIDFPYTLERHTGAFAGLSALVGEPEEVNHWATVKAIPRIETEPLIEAIARVASRFHAYFEDADRLEARRRKPVPTTISRDGNKVELPSHYHVGSFEHGQHRVREQILEASSDLADSLAEATLEYGTLHQTSESLAPAGGDLASMYAELQQSLEELDRYDIVRLEPNRIRTGGPPATPESEETQKLLSHLLNHELNCLKDHAELNGKLAGFVDFINLGLLGTTSIEVNRDVGFEIRRYGSEDPENLHEYVVIPPWHLSSGNQHRVSLALSVLFETPPGGLLLIDEPEMSLDVRWQRSLVDDLLFMAKSARLTLILATHSSLVTHDWPELLVPQAYRSEKIEPELETAPEAM